jgi:bifunctional non-homologous end joining protein LigD
MADVVRVGNYDVEITNKDKVLFPDDGITKGDLIDYYQRIADVMLPYMKGRPITMHRFPDGINDEGFYQQEVSDYFPDWIKRIDLVKENGKIIHLICDNAATLVYLANQACITHHVWLSRDDKINYPDMLIFDLDPSSDDFNAVRQAALYLRELLSELGLESFAKTTGSRGVHIITPLDRSIIFDKVRVFAQDVARVLANRYAEKVTDEQRKKKRGSRVFIDTLRNSYGQTVVAPYAVRAKPGAPVATPLDWDELANKKINSQSYTIKNVLMRLSKKRDPWQGMWHHAYSLREAIDKLDNLR